MKEPCMKTFFFFALAVSALFGAAGPVPAGRTMPGTEDKGLVPFVFGQVEPGSVADMSGLLEAPAGRHGFVRSVGEKFFAGKREILFNGVNLTGGACAPSHEDAAITADRLARHGFNCVRLHYADSPAYGNFRTPAAPVLVANDPDTLTRFDKTNLDRFDRLVAELKKRGIYVNINLRVGLTLDGRDGFPDGPSHNRGVCAIDPRIMEFEKRYARDLLKHVNPYTGLAYADDPAVAIVEIRNESALPMHWNEGLLDDLAEPWCSQYRSHWNRWLEKKYGTREALASAWGGDWAAPFGRNEVVKGRRSAGGPAYPHAVTNDFVRFIVDLDRDYWREMSRFLKKELGVKCVVIGTRVGFTSPYFHDDGFLDAVDEHWYWSHPQAIGKKDGVWQCLQTAQVNFPEDVLNKGAQRIAGMPFTFTETSEPFPSLYGAEHLPIMHAYGAFQGWAGVFAYTWNHEKDPLPDHVKYFFSHAGRPDTQAHFPACAAISLGRAVAPARTRITVPAPESGYLKRVAEHRRVLCFANEALPEGVYGSWDEVLRHGFAADLTGKAPVPRPDPRPADRRWRTDTGELLWDASVVSNGFVKLDTDNVKFFTGFPAGRAIAFSGVKLSFGKLRTGFATVTMFSKNRSGFGADGRPARILVAATGIAKNTGQVFEMEKGRYRVWHDSDGIWTTSYGDKWGRGPTLVECVPFTLDLDADPSSVSCRALDGCGRPVGQVPVSSAPAGGTRIAFGTDHGTLWYELAVSRSVK